ncbi:hypothetical protein HY631_04630 [Candidatus Uhrbacteria bacterium]|nr:hypothetical protein [Candidatus Uhrbacteria bacterium]
MTTAEATTVRILVLDDGETWEDLPETSNALVVDVTHEEYERIGNGERVDEVLGSRTGTRVAWLAARARE